jgi:hypothetical protein
MAFSDEEIRAVLKKKKRSLAQRAGTHHSEEGQIPAIFESCPDCNAMVDNSISSCPGCGRSLSEKPTSQQTPLEETNEKKPTEPLSPWAQLREQRRKKKEEQWRQHSGLEKFGIVAFSGFFFLSICFSMCHAIVSSLIPSSPKTHAASSPLPSSPPKTETEWQQDLADKVLGDMYNRHYAK